MDLIEIRVGNLTGEDVGNRLVVTSEGVAFDGTLTRFAVDRSDYDLPGRDRVTASLTVGRLEAGARRDTTLAEIRLTNLPLDYLVQKETR